MDAGRNRARGKRAATGKRQPAAHFGGAGLGATATPGPTVDTVVYYQDNSGYLVPVMRSIPETDGIAKATLSPDGAKPV